MRVDLKALQDQQLPVETGDFLALTDRDGPNAEQLAKARRVVSGYCSIFASQSEKCLGCGSQLGGFMGSFTWGLVNGEGTCCCCGWPARAVHRIDLGDIGGLTVQAILQYHPSQLDTTASNGEERR